MLPLAQLCLLAGMLFIFTRHVFFFNFLCDDAFISFRYAGNLVHHGELAFNLGQRIEGYSNFLWTLMLAAGMGLGQDPLWLSRVLGWVFGALGIFLVWRVGVGDGFSQSEAERGMGLERFSVAGIIESQTALLLTATLTFLAPMVLALSSSYACWSSGGLETQAFTFLLAAAVFRFLVEERDEEAGEPVRRWSGLLFAVATLMRPEGAAYFAMAVLWRGGKLVRWGLFRRETRRAMTASLRRDLEGILMFSIPVAAWLFWKISYYGDLVPNTFHIKTSGLRMVSRGGWDLANYLDTTKMYVLVPLMLLGCLADFRYFRERWGKPRSGTSMSFLLLMCVATLLYYVWIGGDFMELARFLVPALPFAALLSQEGIFLLFNIAGAGRRRVGFYALVLTWVFFFIVISFFGFYGQLQLAASAYAMTDHSKGGTDSIGYLKKATAQWTIVAQYLKDDARKLGLGEKVTLATSAAGVIPYYTEFTTLDLLGLNDPLIPRMNLTAGNRPGHMVGADWNYIMLWHADYFIGHPEIDPRPKVLTQFDLGFMKNLGYDRRVAAPRGLDPPFFSYWVRAN